MLIFWTSSGGKTGASSKEIQIYCPDAALVLLHMLRKIINEVRHQIKEGHNNKCFRSTLLICFSSTLEMSIQLRHFMSIDPFHNDVISFEILPGT